MKYIRHYNKLPKTVKWHYFDPTRRITPNSAVDIVVLLLLNCNGGTMESAITVKGQATIPKAIREHLRLRPGDRVKFFVHPDGSVVLLPKVRASALRGIIKSRRRPVAIVDMTEAAAEGAAGVRPRPRRR
jgi:AbrB family looped-hinge helix DNA binding protein